LELQRRGNVFSRIALNEKGSAMFEALKSRSLMSATLGTQTISPVQVPAVARATDSRPGWFQELVNMIEKMDQSADNVSQKLGQG
jgi:hypothetical protein